MRFSLVLLAGLLVQLVSPASWAQKPLHIAVISSYHAEYQWSQGTNVGLTRGLIDFGYLDNHEQAQAFTEQGRISNERIEMRKYWMDTKRKSSELEIANTLATIVAQLEEFAPDILLLGDDNAANYVGNYYLDTTIPIVFWGVNGTPLKYGLLDSIERPGHNVTGIYQKNYYAENLQLLLRRAPDVKRVAILSDDSATGRTHSKLFRKAVEASKMPIELLESVNTNDFASWKTRAARLAQQVDAFLISTLYTIRNERGDTLSDDEILRWYLKHIAKPEAVAPINLVRSGMLASVFDSPYKQGYETARVAHRILGGGEKPADIEAYAPQHGGYVVNRWRAGQLGLSDRLDADPDAFHELIDDHVVLDP